MPSGFGSGFATEPVHNGGWDCSPYPYALASLEKARPQRIRKLELLFLSRILQGVPRETIATLRQRFQPRRAPSWQACYFLTSPNLIAARMSRSLSVSNLNVQHASFLAHYLELGGRPEDGPEAAKRAGLAESDEDAKRSAAILLGSDRIQKRLKEEVQKRFVAASNIAFQTIIDLAQNARNESTRLAAARECLEKGGIVTISRSAMDLRIDNSAEALLEALERKERGEAIEYTDEPDAIDAEFVELPKSSLWSPRVMSQAN